MTLMTTVCASASRWAIASSAGRVSASIGWSSERSMGVSVGFSVGYEWENDLAGAGGSAKATFEAQFDYYANQSKTRESWYSHTTAPGEDKIVFSTVPFDVYYYTIVSSPNGQRSQSSGMPSPSESGSVSQESGTPLPLQSSIVPSRMSHTSSTSF